MYHVVHEFIFSHLDYFLLSFFGEYIACERPGERKRVVFVLVNLKEKCLKIKHSPKLTEE